nr:MAG: replication associated protein [Cressdnaviricota sp.]
MSNWKTWKFTWNNATEEDEAKLQRLEVTYIAYGREVAPTTGTKHLQGYIIFRCNVTFKGLKHMFPLVSWKKETHVDAMNYSFKEDNDPFIKDNRQKGKRTDLDKAYDAVKEKKRMKEFLEERPSYQAIKVYEIASSWMQEDRNFKPIVIWIYGPTGVGKTYGIVNHEKDLWMGSNIGDKWLRYQNQEAVLFDDFRPDQIDFAKLLRVLDGYPYYADVKFSDRTFNSKRIYITSNRHPIVIYEGRAGEEDMKQLENRVDVLYWFKNETETEVKKGLILPFLTNRSVHGGRAEASRKKLQELSELIGPRGARADNPTPGPSPPSSPQPHPAGNDFGIISDEVA